MNPIFTEYKVILDYCKLFLNGTNSYNSNHEYDVFALIIPSEKLFEKLVKQFCSEIRHENFIKIISERPGRKHLAIELLEDGKIENRFNLINDIILKTLEGHIIIDTKYKSLHESQQDNGIKQSDLYQMVGYGISSGVKYIKLLYPAKLFSTSKIVATYKIEDLYVKDTFIEVKALKLDVIHLDRLDIYHDHNSILEIFKNSKNRIIKNLETILEFDQANYLQMNLEFSMVAENRSDYNL